ncbi:MAG: hypothetical protein EOS36_16525 [Mesorhizobium sp.]|nr:MAG: hypothetical protein EOS36_16525 [Mesorhizobium sp.]
MQRRGRRRLRRERRLRGRGDRGHPAPRPGRLGHWQVLLDALGESRVESLIIEIDARFGVLFSREVFEALPVEFAGEQRIDIGIGRLVDLLVALRVVPIQIPIEIIGSSDLIARVAGRLLRRSGFFDD